MATLGEFAKSYEPPKKTKNIAELKEVSTVLDLKDDSYEVDDEATGKKVTVNQKVIEVDGEKYRVPLSVISQVKVLLEDNPKLQKFKVKKSGSTKEDTKYQVIPLM